MILESIQAAGLDTWKSSRGRRNISVYNGAGWWICLVCDNHVLREKWGYESLLWTQFKYLHVTVHSKSYIYHEATRNRYPNCVSKPVLIVLKKKEKKKKRDFMAGVLSGVDTELYSQSTANHWPFIVDVLKSYFEFQRIAMHLWFVN